MAQATSDTGLGTTSLKAAIRVGERKVVAVAKGGKGGHDKTE